MKPAAKVDRPEERAKGAVVCGCVCLDEEGPRLQLGWVGLACSAVEWGADECNGFVAVNLDGHENLQQSIRTNLCK
uniref:Uncharacterized protein n=1 Tax=Oryza punctata TaxID=4537 RepID=A0A1V1H0M0_ORYPU|nr:hypothetical protein [Oryza punctata]